MNWGKKISEAASEQRNEKVGAHESEKIYGLSSWASVEKPAHHQNNEPTPHSATPARSTAAEPALARFD